MVTPETVPSPNPRTSSQAFGARQTVLLVTGDANLREAAGQAIEAAGYRVTTAAHSGHALLAGLAGAHIDILVSELVTDDLSGPGLASRLRRHHPDLRAVYFASPGTPTHAGVLVCPFTRDALLAELLGARPSHRPSPISTERTAHPPAPR